MSLKIRETFKEYIRQNFQRQKYDYYLIIATALILFAVGIVCVYGISDYNYLASPDWTNTIQYTNYIDDMNSYLYPFLVLLLITLGLCIPKRLFETYFLIKFSAMVLGATLVLTYLYGIETGLGFILAIMTGVQSIVLVLTLRKSKIIRYEKEGYVSRVGSSLLHLGVVVLIFDFVSLQDSSFHIAIFWLGTVFVIAGSIFSFYAHNISKLLPFE